MRLALVTVAVLSAFIAPAAPATAQVEVQGGAYGAHGPDLYGGVSGAGALLTIELPMLPMRVRGFGERYFPDCGAHPTGDDRTGCSYWGAGLDALLILPFPVAEPYLAAGLVYRVLDAGDTEARDQRIGAAVGAGLTLPAGPVDLFGEGRYEMIEFDAHPAGVPEPVEHGWIFRVGLLIGIL